MQHTNLEEFSFLDKPSVESIQDSLEDNGAVLIHDVIDKDYLRMLKVRMDEDSKTLLEFCQEHGYQPTSKGHLQQTPPTHPPYLHRDVLAQPFIWSVLKGLLGNSAGIIFLGGNTNCPDSEPQSVHIDQPHPNDGKKPTSTLILSIPVQHMGPENGSIEIWPGSHKVPSQTKTCVDDLFHRRKSVPPVQPTVKVGSVLLRNSRTWHRGTRNTSSDYRHMISVVINKEPKNKVLFDYSAREFLERENVSVEPEYTDFVEEYLFEQTRTVNLIRAGISDDLPKVTPLIEI